MESFCIPWPCVDLAPKQSKQPEPVKTQKSFAQAVSNVCEIPLSQFPQACVKGDRLAIPIPEEDYMAGIDACKHNLHGRIIWPRGATPLTVADLKIKLSSIWKGLSKWGVSSLGRGYYEFVFSTLEDVRRVRSTASWNLSPGALKLFAWSKDFNPRFQQNVSAQVWVRIYGLSQEYWRPNIIFAVASSIGTPICIDAVTAKPMIDRTFGQFVRVLVDMDLSQTLRDNVLVERKGFAFFVDLDYENLPQFCSNCKVIGHHVGICKKLNIVEEVSIVNEFRENRKPAKDINKVFVQKKDGRLEKNKETEVVNVESDKDELHVPVNLSSANESKNKEANCHMNASSSTKTSPHKSIHNRFAVLE
ncbi:hypothetical protein A2U01_0014270, partial [Trifolium medium]|nr:hypothetical protein [Trifolium medium]